MSNKKLHKMERGGVDSDYLKHISYSVLDFYKTLPFNYLNSPMECVDSIKHSNIVTAYFPSASEILREESSLLEVGCGIGWFANSVQYYYSCNVTAIDFNPTAVKFAENTAKALSLTTNFKVADWFEFQSNILFDVVTSFGVLHHTGDCLGALGKMCSLVKHGGTIVVGLYHKYGRAPFLEYFDKMKKNGSNEQKLFEKYKELDSNHTNETHLRSWFRDQVLHPYETQHTLEEVYHVFERHNIKLNRTSINSFVPFDNIEKLFEDEKELYKRAEDMLRQKKYYTGFFIVEGIKK